MNFPDIAVIASGIVLIGFLGWFFFGPKKARQAELVGQVQQVQILVKGGYAPNLIRVRQSVPLRMVFDRQEGGEWSQWQRSHPDTFADVSCATVGDDIHVIALTQTGITVHSILTAQGHWQGFQKLPQQPIMEE